MSQRAFALALKGSPSLAEPLGAALWAQWKYGFPIVPKPGLPLTHEDEMKEAAPWTS